MPPLPNLRLDVLLRGEETGGHVSVPEIVVPPHSAGPPAHTHDFDEAFYVLEGELIHACTANCGPTTVTAGIGCSAHHGGVTPGTPHRELLLELPSGTVELVRYPAPTRPRPGPADPLRRRSQGHQLGHRRGAVRRAAAPLSAQTSPATVR